MRPRNEYWHRIGKRVADRLLLMESGARAHKLELLTVGSDRVYSCAKDSHILSIWDTDRDPSCFCPSYSGGSLAHPQQLSPRSGGVRIDTHGCLAIDNSGALYYTGKNSVFKLGSDGNPVRIAGNGCEGFSGDG